MRSFAVADLAGFRALTRRLIAARVSPVEVTLTDALAGQMGLIAADTGDDLAPADEGQALSIPRALGELVTRVACHRDEGRWQLLYRVIHRTCHGERHLVEVAADPDMARLLSFDAAIRRDVHKTHAFVRFRRVEVDDGERFVAFHRPDHRVLPLAVALFLDRFASMRWSILTPDASAHWDGHELTWSGGVTAREAPAPDELEALFRDYYRATFNPARLNLRAMRAEMPQKHWPTMPETEALPAMIREATERVDAMLLPQVPGRRGRLAARRRS